MYPCRGVVTIRWSQPRETLMMRSCNSGGRGIGKEGGRERERRGRMMERVIGSKCKCNKDVWRGDRAIITKIFLCIRGHIADLNGIVRTDHCLEAVPLQSPEREEKKQHLRL